MKRAWIVVVMLVAISQISFGQKPAVVLSNEPGWHKIGEVTASFKLESEGISVLGADQFEKIKLRVTDAPINIEGITIFYENGETENVNVRHEMQAGADTRIIDLKSPAREIQKVVFTYKSLPSFTGDKAHVELYGYKTEKQGDSYRDDKEHKDLEDAADNTEKDVENAAEKTGNDMSEAAGNVAADIKDKVYDGKMGPDGQTIYIDKHSKYYYISDDGKKVYLAKIELKDKPKKDKD